MTDNVVRGAAAGESADEVFRAWWSAACVSTAMMASDRTSTGNQAELRPLRVAPVAARKAA